MSDRPRREPIWRREPAVLVAVAGAVITIAIDAGLDLAATTQSAITTIVWLVAGGAIRHEVTPEVNVRELAAEVERLRAQPPEFP